MTAGEWVVEELLESDQPPNTTGEDDVDGDQIGDDDWAFGTEPVDTEEEP